MKLKNPLLLTVAALSATLLLTNCASLTGFQTGRTVGEGNGEFLVSLNASQTPDFDFNKNDTTDLENFFFPNIELSGRYGIVEKLDIGLRVNTYFNLALDARYQVLGDRESPVAMSVGAGVGTFALFAPLWNVQIPLYLSFHPSDAIDIYITPRYTAQFGAGDFTGSLSYFGGNAGILFGKRTKFGIDAGLYSIRSSGSDGEILPISTIGIGVKIPFGNN